MAYRDTKITDFEIKKSEPAKRETSSETLPSSASPLRGFKIQVTNSFAIQFSYLSQLLLFAAKNQDKPKISRADYVDYLGLTERHVESICSVAVALGLVSSQKLAITQMGKTMAEGDPYLEYTGSLWLLHYIISSNSKWLIWNTLMNEVFPTKHEITSEEAKASFNHLREKLSKFTVTKKIQREIAIVLDAYTNKALSKLALVTKEDSSYTFHKPDHIPPEILTATILIFRQRYNPTASGVCMEALIHESNSPGRILNLEESTMRKILEQAHQKGLLYIERKADLDQIRFRGGITIENLLKTYYEGLRNERK
jgi:hypothetical protein